jgi:hypothetical protein
MDWQQPHQEQWRTKGILTTDEQIAFMGVTDVRDGILVVALCGKIVADELAERWIVKGREDRSLVSRGIENTLVHLQRMDDRRRKRRLIPLLFFAEDSQ